jgi:hypothetical protein
LCIKKYNNIVRLIRSCESEYLQDTRWARLYALTDLEYSEPASKELFRAHCPGPVLFDDMLWKNFNILLIPAFGNVQFESDKIKVSNEGRGSIDKPNLEFWFKGHVLFRISLHDTILAGQTGTFKLEQMQLDRLRNLNPNEGKLRLFLQFAKFEQTFFRFTQSVDVSEVLAALPVMQ